MRWFAFIKSKDPAAGHFLNILINYPGVHAVLIYRLAHLLHFLRLRLLARLISQIGRFLTGIEIHPGARIGKCLFIDHGSGVVIGATAVIGDYVVLYHQVTLGAKGNDNGGKRHPSVESQVTIGAGAKVLGDIVIGKGAIIGAGSVVTKSVRPRTLVAGVPAREIRSLDQAVE